MNRKKIPYGSKIPVRLTLRERDLIRDHTFYNPDFSNLAIVDGVNVRLDLSLDDVEEIEEHVAAEANHCNDRKLRKELEGLFSKFRELVDSYDDEPE